jgi:hypothetical protein
MNEREKAERDELRDAWIESLLVTATRPQNHAERIARAMSQIESGPVGVHLADAGRKRRRFVSWMAIGATAAVFLASLLLVQDGGTQSAMAAIQRSLDVAAQRITRKYLLEVEYRPANGRPSKITNDLYVQGNDRFALRHPGLLPGTSFWVGRNGAESWVLPAIGPVLKGDNTVLSRWLRSHDELDTPYLHVTTVLARMMSRGFRLETLRDEEFAVPNGPPVECQHIRAHRKMSDQPGLPETIELWASRESGMAVRLVARWTLAEGESGRESVVLTFQNEEPSLSGAWFSAEGHYAGRRPMMRFDAPDNLDN